VKLQIGIDGKSYELEVEIVEDDELPPLAHYGPYNLVPATVQSSPAAIVRASAPVAEESNVDEALVCRSPVAGLVVRVNVQPGQQVQPNDLLMVLEAMKMETNVTAHSPGKVKKVRVGPGDAVKMDQVVVDLE
jgi:methylmalonyl-CoA carboxyltransferase small subunit